MAQHAYGWKRDLPDHRDLRFVRPKTKKKIQKFQTVALFDNYNIPPVYDQSALGSCTANAAAGILQFAMMNKSATPNPSAQLFYPSRLYIYWWERFIEGSVGYDSGASIRDSIKVLSTYGACSENMLPYDISKFTDKPSDSCVSQAKNFEVSSYQKVDNTSRADLVAALSSGHPITFGFTVYESFESEVVSSTGIVPMPDKNESILGGHAVVIMGYNATGNYYVVRNSWGKGWGINGYCHMPAAYIENEDLANDFWIVDFAGINPIPHA
jgi:C1A family cysteine protease